MRGLCTEPSVGVHPYRTLGGELCPTERGGSKRPSHLPRGHRDSSQGVTEHPQCARPPAQPWPCSACLLGLWADAWVQTSEPGGVLEVCVCVGGVLPSTAPGAAGRKLGRGPSLSGQWLLFPVKVAVTDASDSQPRPWGKVSESSLLQRRGRHLAGHLPA